MSEERKIMVEEVDAVEMPPKARVDAPESGQRQRDYLEGFLAAKPAEVEAGEPGGGGAFVEEHDPRDGGAGGADAGPDGVGGAEREAANGEREQPDAGDERGDHARAGPEAGEIGGGFQADRPDDFERGGEQQQEPVHGKTRSRARRRREGGAQRTPPMSRFTHGTSAKRMSVATPTPMA